MISSLYASLLGLVFLVLTVRVIKLRKSLKVSLGDDGNDNLQRAIRAQGNFSETVPLALILIFLGEFSGLRELYVHLCGITILLGRIFHAYGISQNTNVNSHIRFRVAGMVLTFASIIISLLFNLVLYFLTL